MSLKYSVAKFLKQKLQEKKLNKKAFSQDSGINYKTIMPITLGQKSNPHIKTLIKFANYFNCSLDEVMGRDPKYYDKIQKNNYDKYFDPETIDANLKKFILTQTKQHNITLNKLSLDIGFNGGFIADFIKEHRVFNSLGSNAILALANYFDSSVDQIIGRNKSQEQSINITQSLQTLPTDDFKKLDRIKQNISTPQPKSEVKTISISNINTKKQGRTI